MSPRGQGTLQEDNRGIRVKDLVAKLTGRGGALFFTPLLVEGWLLGCLKETACLGGLRR